MTEYIVNNNLGDVASVIGLFVTFIGFIITIIKVRKTQNAAESAERAAGQMHKSIRKLDALSEISSITEMLSEIKRLQREKSWKVALDRYGFVKKSLINIKSTYSDLSNDHKKKLQGAIQHLTNIEASIEIGLEYEDLLPAVPEINNLLAKQIDRLNEIITTMKNKVVITNR